MESHLGTNGVSSGSNFHSLSSIIRHSLSEKQRIYLAIRKSSCMLSNYLELTHRSHRHMGKVILHSRNYSTCSRRLCFLWLPTMSNKSAWTVTRKTCKEGLDSHYSWLLSNGKEWLLGILDQFCPQCSHLIMFPSCCNSCTIVNAICTRHHRKWERWQGSCLKPGSNR